MSPDSDQQLANPFPGLRPFEPDEEHLFFGREEAIDELLTRLRTQRFIAVIGMSGSGKSSLVRSGLISALHGGFMAHAGSRWRVALLRPGGQPFRRLARALNGPDVLGREDADSAELDEAFLETTLRSSRVGLVEAIRQRTLDDGSRLLVVVDQFEELFRFKHSVGVADARFDALGFVRILLAAVEQAELPIYVVLTMRSDFIGDCMEFPGLPAAINEGLFLVPRLTRDQLRSAVTGPVAVAGGTITPRLVRRLLNEVGDDQDQLPLLQHALMRTWNRWSATNGDGRPIDITDYEAVGTMAEALSRHADEAFAELDSAREREIAERLFRALTDTTSDPRGIRRPCRLGEICELAGAEPEEAAAVIDRFRRPGRSFLMPPQEARLEAETIVDISHESLMRVWPRLQGWAEEESAAARFYARLCAAEGLWEAGEGGLWRAEELPHADAWETTVRPNAAWAARYDPAFDQAWRFLEASRSARRAHLARQRRRRRLRWTMAGAVLVVLLGWLVARETELRRTAANQRAVARGVEVLDAAREVDEPEVQALLLAELDPAVEPPGGVRFALQVAESLGLGLETHAIGPEEKVIGIAFRREDPMVFTTRHDDYVVRVWKAGFSEGPVELRGHEGTVLSAALDADGNRVVTASGDRTARMWRLDAPDSDPVVLRGHGDMVASAAFSPDGGRVVTASLDRTARVWSVADPAVEPVTLRGHAKMVHSAVFSPDGTRVLTASEDGTARNWPAGGGAEPFKFRHPEPVTSAAFAPGGQRLVTTSSDGFARVWAAGRTTSPTVLRQRDDELDHALFSHDGGKILTVANDGQVKVWNADGSGEPVLLSARGGGVKSAAFGPDDERVVTASEEGTVRIWQVGWAALLAELRGASDRCLDSDQRFRYLGESLTEADARWKACERRRGRR